jgi:hypothetical protein
LNTPFVVRDTPYIVQFLYYGTVFGSVVESTITGSGTLYLQGKSGADRVVHFQTMNFNHNGTDVSFEIYESSVFTANGTTTINAINQNRNSAKTAQFTAYSDPPTPTSDGTLITKERIFGTSGGVGQSVSAATLDILGTEIILKKNTDYSMKIINHTTANTSFVVHWNWFESGN